MTSYVQVLGTQPLLVPPQLLVTHNQFRFLVNAGENTQRFGLEHGVRFSKVTDIFLTRISPETFLGLPGLLLTIEISGNTAPLKHEKRNKDYAECCVLPCRRQWIPFVGPLANCRSFRRERPSPAGSEVSAPACIRIWGPPPLFALFSRVSYQFASLRYLDLEIHEVLPTPAPQPSIPVPLNDSNAVTLRLWCIKEPTSTSLEPKRRKLSESLIDIASTALPEAREYTMVIEGQFPSTSGKLDMERVTALKIPKGPLLGKLKAGQSISLPDGRTVDSSDVCGSPVPGGSFLVVDVIDSRLVPLLHALKESPFTVQADQVVVYNLSQSACSPRLNDVLMQAVPPSWTVLSCREPEFALSYQPFVSSAGLHGVLQSILPQFSAASVFDSAPLSLPMEPEDSCSALCKYIFYPVSKRGLFTTGSISERQPRYTSTRLEALSAIEKEVDSCRNLFEEAFRTVDVCRDTADVSECCSVDFLGTGAAMPSKYRNVSATHVRLDHPLLRLGVLFDCGEGTLTQLLRYAPSVSDFKQRVHQLHAVFVSHRHADHHLGLPALLAARHRWFPDAKAPVVFGPSFLLSWLEFWDTQVALCPYRFVSCDENATATLIAPTEKLPYSVVLDVTDVDHIRSQEKRDLGEGTCYAVRLTVSRVSDDVQSRLLLRIVYSGDTRPCENLVKLAKDCDVLIHEATFDDTCPEEAVNKCHSTVGEALTIGQNSCSSYVLLTHFSQRYPSIPATSDTATVPMAHASAPMLDGISIPLHVLKHPAASRSLSQAFRQVQPILATLRDAV